MTFPEFTSPLFLQPSATSPAITFVSLPLEEKHVIVVAKPFRFPFTTHTQTKSY